MRSLLGSVMAWLVAAALWSADDGRSWSADTRELYYGIPVTVRFTPEDPALAARVWQVLEAIDDDFNDYRATSALGRINAGGPGVYALNESLADAFALAGRLRTTTQGACEITVGPLRRLWKGAAAAGQWPTAEAIAAAKACVGPEVYRLTDHRLEVLRPGVSFDFGGVCKGMAVDRAVALLRAAGCSAALVQVGGETCCWGMAPAGRPHRLAIPHPDDPDNPAAPWCRLQDPGTGFAGSTSGNYRLPVMMQGKPLYHIYDPRTGQTADTRVVSFSVIMPGSGRNGEADGLTKSGVLLGDQGLAVVAAAGGEALLLRRRADGRIEERHTPGWARYVLP